MFRFFDDDEMEVIFHSLHKSWSTIWEFRYHIFKGKEPLHNCNKPFFFHQAGHFFITNKEILN